MVQITPLPAGDQGFFGGLFRLSRATVFALGEGRWRATLRDAMSEVDDLRVQGSGL